MVWKLGGKMLNQIVQKTKFETNAKMGLIDQHFIRETFMRENREGITKSWECWDVGLPPIERAREGMLGGNILDFHIV